jgi:hypothetical protein
MVNYQKAGSRLKKVLIGMGSMDVEVHSTAKGTRIKYSFPYTMEREGDERGKEFDDARLAMGVGRLFGVALSKWGAPDNYRITVKGSGWDGEGKASFTVGSCGIWWEDRQFLFSCEKELFEIEETVFRGMLRK